MMYIILTYDVNQKRVSKVHKLIKQYLNWIQNSVFEGEIRESKLKELLEKLNRITKEEDKLIYFETPTIKNIIIKDLHNNVKKLENIY